MPPTPSEPKLQPPGAGLPFLQMLAIRLWIGPVVSHRTPAHVSRETYERLTGKLIRLISQVPADQRKIRVLVPPITGLEDSSRYWSLNGVLEHLLIVSKNIEGVILSLSQGKVPPGEADTAKVKPQHMEADALVEFSVYAPKLMERLDEAMKRPGFDFASPAKFRHPWFGLMTAQQWYWLLASHQGIHYRQAKGILQGLAKDSNDSN